MVGVVPPPRARRGGADRGHGHDRRARARRRAGARQGLARLHVLVPRAGAQDLGRVGRSGDRKTLHGRRSTTSSGSSRSARGKDRADEPLPRALIPGQPIHDKEQRERALAARPRVPRRHGATRAVRAVLERAAPTRAARPRAGRRGAATIEDSYLFVQGPPGSGKTWQGAKMAVALMRDGKRVGVTSLSHKAIHKLLEEIEREAREQGFVFKGREEVDGRERRSRASRARFIDNADSWRDLLDDGAPARRRHGVALRARGLRGLRATRSSWTRLARSRSPTRWRSARSRATSSSSATRTSCRRCHRAHSPRRRRCRCSSTCSATTRRCRRIAGSSSSETWRLRPEICAFTSEAYYEGRLVPAEVSDAGAARGRRTGLVLDQSSTRGAASPRGRRRTRSPRRSASCSGRRSPTTTA